MLAIIKYKGGKSPNVRQITVETSLRADEAAKRFISMLAQIDYVISIETRDTEWEKVFREELKKDKRIDFA